MPDPTGLPSGPGPQRLGRVRSALAFGLVAALLALAPVVPAAASHPRNGYHQTNLVSDLPGLAQLTDPDLVNPWGLAAGPTTPAWVADNGTDKATIYPGFVNGSPIQKAGLVVNIPGGAPTGQVFNPTTGFVVRSGAASGAALFLFNSEAGLVTGWNPGVPPPPPSTQAQVGASVRHAIYKGLAIATTAHGTFLYGADFHHGRIDVFDQGFNRVHLSGRFQDRRLPRGFAPFNIQELGGRLYVAYAKQDADRADEIAGPGLGFVDVYSTSGHLLRRLVRRGHLNAPWGLVVAPAGFGRFSGDLLVGNFGNGRINAYNLTTGAFHGRLRHEDGTPIEIEGLWALRFGNGVTGNPTTLLFTAGIDDEAHGLFGAIDAAS
ncbi:MAG: TIGR03118 family protein [Actinomycetota bacterium]